MSYETFLQVEVRVQATGWRPKWSHCLRVHLPERSWLGDAFGSSFPIRGLPDDVTDSALDEGAVLIDDEADAIDVYDTCSATDAERLIGEGVVHRIKGEYITHPDYHSFTSLSASEFLSLAAECLGTDYEKAALMAASAAIRSFEQSGYEARLILWRLH